MKWYYWVILAGLLVVAITVILMMGNEYAKCLDWYQRLINQDKAFSYCLFRRTLG